MSEPQGEPNLDHGLRQRLEGIICGSSDEQVLLGELAFVCEAMPDAAWDVLALTDQYYRRRRISAGLFRSIRVAITRQALSTPVMRPAR